MTVQDNTLKQTQKARQEDIAKIKEFTSITDHGRIEKAIDDCTNDQGVYDLSDVIEKLMENVGPFPSNQPVLVYGPQNRITNQDQKFPADASTVIDLTGNERVEPEGAEGNNEQLIGILGGQISQEEQDISRILEQSLEESKIGTKRKRADLWFVDPRNPHERKRVSNWPVGMKNVGNTCWFSAVVQSLFHVKKFRRQVLNFTPKNWEGLDGPSKRNIAFMSELRRIFGLMIASKRKYIDPTKAIDILRDAFTGANSAATVSNAGNQQDVSEFQHKLLEWLEEAFSYQSSDAASAHVEQTDDAQLKNPMVELFYGHYTVEGVNNGERFKKTEKFSQFPLQVGGYADIYESLEAATACGEVESAKRDVSSNSGHELWFTSLPPLLTLELSRFQFNQHLNEPEKIHARMEFPEVLFMARYMAENKERTRAEREMAKQLQLELIELNSKLNRYKNFGSGVRQYPIKDILQYALEFAQAGSRDSGVSEVDVEMESPHCSMTSESASQDRAAHCGSAVESLKPGYNPDNGASQHDISSVDFSNGLDLPLLQSLTQNSALSTAIPYLSDKDEPAPKFVSEHELAVLQSCLVRWRTEIEENVKDLDTSIKRLESVKSGLYSDEIFRRHSYRLHAVLVHDGQAASGHYWVYIYSSERNKWLRYNDISVTEATWEELAKESVGGYHNTSAYCLMYISETELGAQGASEDEALPADITSDVDEDNGKFQKELEEWDEEMQSKLHKSDDRRIEEEPIGREVKRLMPSPATSCDNLSLHQRHAQLLANHLQEQICSQKHLLKNCKLDDFVSILCAHELNLWAKVAGTLNQSLPFDDRRLDNVIVYAIYTNIIAKPELELLILQQVANAQLDCLEGFNEVAGRLYDDKIKKLSPADKENVDKLIGLVHDEYEKFRQCASFFVEGINFIAKEDGERALDLLACCCDRNMELSRCRDEAKCLNQDIILQLLQHCLLMLSTVAARQLQAGQNTGRAFEMMQRKVLPTLACLMQLPNHDGHVLVEKIGFMWCELLSMQLPDDEVTKLQDCLSALYENPVEPRPVYSPALLSAVPTTDNLREHYVKALDYIKPILCS